MPVFPEEVGVLPLVPGGLRQVMGFLASVFPGRFPVTRSHQPAVLSAPLELPRSGSVRMGREGEGRKETGFRVYGLVPLGGFNRSEHRPHRPECGFCPFAIRRVRPAMPRGGATGGGRVGLQFPPCGFVCSVMSAGRFPPRSAPLPCL